MMANFAPSPSRLNRSTIVLQLSARFAFESLADDPDLIPDARPLPLVCASMVSPRILPTMTIDPLEFCSVIGTFATGVTVMTAAAGDELQGMTANAVTSLSLDPVMMLVCVSRNAHTHRIVGVGGAFAVNILGAHQEKVSQLFAKKAAPERGKLRGQPFHLGKTGAPVLEDCLAFIECRVATVLEGGDHSIFLGEVVDMGIVKEGEPLLFYRARYRTLSSS